MTIHIEYSDGKTENVRTQRVTVRSEGTLWLGTLPDAREISLINVNYFWIEED